MRRPDLRTVSLGVLVLAFALLLNAAQHHSLRPDEAWLAYTVHYNPTDVSGQLVNLTTPREVVSFVRDDVLSALERTASADILTRGAALLLNLWALLVGDSEIALRLPTVYAVLILLACAFMLLRRSHWHRLISVGVLAGGAVLVQPLLIPAPDWRGFVAQVAERRQVTEPALVAWSPDSAIAYYDRRTPIRIGISIDVGWRAFPREELAELIIRFDYARAIWVLIDQRDDLTTEVVTLLDADRSLLWGYRDRLEGFVAYRFSR